MCRVWSAEPWDISDPGWGSLGGGNLLTQQPQEGSVTLATNHHISSCLYLAVLDPCASGPCLNGGTCSSTQDHVSYHCACPLAFTGKDCGTGEGTSGTQEWGLSGSLGEQRLSPAWGGRCLPGRGDLHECCGSTV